MLRSCDESFSFSGCELRSDVEFWHPSHRRANTGLNHVVRVSNHIQNKDVEGLGRPKEFTGREEDFQQWSKKTEAFCAEMMLEWAVEQPTEITTTAIVLEFFADGHERGQRSAKLGDRSAADAHRPHGSYEL